MPETACEIAVRLLSWRKPSRIAVVACLWLTGYQVFYFLESMGTADNRRFSWMSYVQLNIELNDKSYIFTEKDFRKKCDAQGRRYEEPLPKHATVDAAIIKMKQYDVSCNSIPVFETNLIIYYCPRFDPNAAKVTLLNLLMFLRTIQPQPCSTPRLFYLFIVNDGEDSDYHKMIPHKLPHVGVVHWHEAVPLEQYYQTFLTLEALGVAVLQHFGAVFLLGVNLRGPLLGREKNAWISHYRGLLDQHNVGLVSPVRCDEIPLFLPTLHHYGSAFRTSLLELILAEFAIVKYHPRDPRGTYVTEMNRLVSNRADSVLTHGGFKFASIVHNLTTGEPYYKHPCVAASSKMSAKDKAALALRVDPAWCALAIARQVFVPWGGNNIRLDGYMCPNLTQQMRQYLGEYQQQHRQEMDFIEQKIGAVDPYEMRYVDPIRELLVQQAEEDRREDQALLALSRPGSPHTDRINPDAVATENVCFLVRTIVAHDAQPNVEHQLYYGTTPHTVTGANFTEQGVRGLIRSLLKQTDPHWVAYLFVTDNQPFHRLPHLAAEYQDARVRYMDIPAQFCPAYTARDGGYTATDYVLRELRHAPHCAWLSITNGDNAYGSEVVSAVRQRGERGLQEPQGHLRHQRAPQMLLAPLDSRNFAALDYTSRYGDKIVPEAACRGINAMLAHNQLAFTAQPVPTLSRVDLASLFLHRASFQDANILFGNFTDPRRYPCAGCQDGYLAEALVQTLQWRYLRMPLDGLKSVVFHGPSPTLCIASGNVWVDSPLISKVGCFTRATVHALRLFDVVGGKSTDYDWDWVDFDRHMGVCLRMTQKGLDKVRSVEQLLDSAQL